MKRNDLFCTYLHGLPERNRKHPMKFCAYKLLFAFLQLIRNKGVLRSQTLILRTFVLFKILYVLVYTIIYFLMRFTSALKLPQYISIDKMAIKGNSICSIETFHS